MTDIERIHYLIRNGEADNAGAWARKLARVAFSDNYSLRVYASSKGKLVTIGRTTHIYQEVSAV